MYYIKILILSMNTFFIYSQLLFVSCGFTNSIVKQQFKYYCLSPNIKNNILYNNNMPILYSNIKSKNNIYSIEHICPISYLITNESKIDMHNLIKTKKEINNARSNYKYSDHEELNYNNLHNNWIKLENNNYVNHKKKKFIPNDESKGLISRALLYIHDKYNIDIYNIIDNDVLIKWYISFPPNENEKYHNNYILNIQNTNNKYISNYKYYREKIYKKIKNKDKDNLNLFK